MPSSSVCMSPMWATGTPTLPTSPRASRRVHFVADGDSAATCDESLGHLARLAGLEPAHAVLDVGCGIGRLARPLATSLDERGSYAGFDVNPIGTGWCQLHSDRERF